MIKWPLILIGGAALIIVAVFCFIMFMIYNHERGYPKAVLSDEYKGTCVVSKKVFFLLKNSGASMREKVFDFLPKPEGVDYIYNSYVASDYIRQDGSLEYGALDTSNAIEIPAGTKFILKDGFQHRTMNDNAFYFWLEPETIKLDSNFYFSPFYIANIDGEIHSYNADQLAEFSNSSLFEKACER